MKRKLSGLIFIFCLLSLAGCVSIYQSVREERDRNYRQGVELYQANRMDEAYARFKTVVDIEPNYKDAKQYLAKIEKVTSVKKKKTERKANINYDKGVELMNRRRYDEALPLLLLAKEQDPDLAEVDEKITDCRGQLTPVFNKAVKQAELQYQKQQYLPAYLTCLKAEKYGLSSSKFISLKEKVKNKLKNLAEKKAARGKQLYDKKNYSAAQTEFQAAWKLCPWDENYKTQLAKTNDRLDLDKNYQRGRKLFEQGEYFEAKAVFSQVNGAEPGYKATARYLDRANDALGKQAKKLYTDGVTDYSNGNYAAAIGEFNKVVAINPAYPGVQEYLERAQTKLNLQKTVNAGAAK